jgi:hypothetical protein
MTLAYTPDQCEQRAASCVLRALRLQRVGLLNHANCMRFRVAIEQALRMAQFWTEGASCGGYQIASPAR